MTTFLLALGLALGPVASTTVDDALAYRDDLLRLRALMVAEDYPHATPLARSLAERLPEDGQRWRVLADCCYQTRDFAAAAEAYRRAADLGTTFPTLALYNAACCEALLGRRDDAVATLRRCLALGYEERAFLLEDTDLTALHDHPAWPELAGLLPPDVVGRDAGWVHDLDFWFGEVRRLHPDPFAATSEAEFAARVQRLRERIPALTDEQVMVELLKLAVLLGDGHSGLRPLPESRVQMRRLPLQLYAFADGLFVIDADSAHASLIGAEVLAIGARPVADLWPRLVDLVPRDNAMRLLQQGPFLLTLTAILRDLGAIGDTETATLQLREPGGGERAAAVASVPLGRVNFELIASRRPAAPPPPLYLARENEVAWFEAIEGGKTLFVQFNVVRDGPDESVAAFADRLRGHLDAHPELDALVLDVRHNGGGNSFLYPPLVKALIHFEQTRPDPRLYVLMGRQTFSACQNFVTDLDWWTGAAFVGEPSGSRPNQIGESTASILPYSGLRAGISSRFHQVSYPGDERAWIAPDLPVALTSEDYFANRDPVLDAALADARRSSPVTVRDLAR